MSLSTPISDQSLTRVRPGPGAGRIWTGIDSSSSSSRLGPPVELRPFAAGRSVVANAAAGIGDALGPVVLVILPGSIQASICVDRAELPRPALIPRGGNIKWTDTPVEQSNATATTQSSRLACRRGTARRCRSAENLVNPLMHKVAKMVT